MHSHKFTNPENEVNPRPFYLLLPFGVYLSYNQRSRDNHGERDVDNIIRNLADGPDYQPDWRHQVAQAYLTEIASATDPGRRLVELLDGERDPFVRQYLRYRYSGICVKHAAFQYAAGCQARNAATGAASMIRAMLIADRTPEEIAAELGTDRVNIVTFAKVFFDLRRYLDNETILRRIVFADLPEGMADTEALRERRWLAAAFHRGFAGVEQVIFHRTPTSPEELERLSIQLHGTLVSRALEYEQDLETRGIAPNEADLSRYLAATATQSRQPERGAQTDQQKTMKTFLQGITGILEKKAEENPEDPNLAAILEIKRARTSAQATTPMRMRKRFVNP